METCHTNYKTCNGDYPGEHLRSGVWRRPLLITKRPGACMQSGKQEIRKLEILNPSLFSVCERRLWVVFFLLFYFSSFLKLSFQSCNLIRFREKKVLIFGFQPRGLAEGFWIHHGNELLSSQKRLFLPRWLPGKALEKLWGFLYLDFTALWPWESCSRRLWS